MRILLSLAAVVFLGSSAFGATVNDFSGTWAGTRVKTYKGNVEKDLEIDYIRATGDGGLTIRSTVCLSSGNAHILYQFFPDGTVEETGVLKRQVYGSYSGYWYISGNTLNINLSADDSNRYGTIKYRLAGGALVLTNVWSDGVKVAARLLSK